MADDTLSLPLGPGEARRRCRKCWVAKPLEEFERRGAARRRGRICKECLNASRDPVANRRHVKEWQQANPEKRRAQTRRSYERARTDLKRTVGLILKGLRARCKGRLDCVITSAEIMALFETQEGRCALTDLPLIWGTEVGSSKQGNLDPDTLSLDRINQAHGYVPGNVRLLGFQANAARGMWSDDRLFAFCEAVLATRAASCSG